MKLTPYEHAWLAALFARSNMGQPIDNIAPLTPKMREYKNKRGGDLLDDTVSDLCQELIENDEHYDIFIGEARMWYEQIAEWDEGYLEKIFPTHYAKLMGEK